MKTRIFGCRKFRHLSNEQLDRDLNSRETLFMTKHREVCPTCDELEVEGGMGLNMLRMASLEPEAKPNFDERIIRRLRVQTVKTSIQYWSPAAIAAMVAGLVLLAALQMITHSNQMPTIRLPGGEARNMGSGQTPAFPNINLGDNELSQK